MNKRTHNRSPKGNGGVNAPRSSVPDRELEDKHRRLWGLGDYPTIAAEVVAPLGQALVSAARIGPGMRVLDVAAGTGNAALAAAAAGADVTATDLVPELLESGEQRAAAQGLELTWKAANAEALPFADGEFDIVMSCIGVMFAPHHQRAAAELVRVCRPGGTIAVLSWTPEGFVGRMFAAMRPYVPAPPAGVSPPPLWGSEGHVVALLNGGVDDLVAERHALAVDRFADGAAFRDYFKANYGPTIVAYRGIADHPDQVAELDAALAELGDCALAEESGMEWEYLVVVARRAAAY
ncbi:methyltransferase domain-containing protein [Mycolicibacterium chitae]|uniref:Type 11 methyltransferase n=1 Tax=Mycolicibacterium chitae TaxID=1792 RepID=A0A448I913_MYCCI|nr:methyltransferase domain-containing protein [Mycolicibacterium chitae]VEG48924.1 type 11 methyltransferase [Mycolicibacterium chitae]